MTFNDLKFKEVYMGRQVKVKFLNNYGASIITGPFTYGGPDGLYELVVLHHGSLCYDSGVTNDVEGYLTTEEVTELLNKIEALPFKE